MPVGKGNIYSMDSTNSKSNKNNLKQQQLKREKWGAVRDDLENALAAVGAISCLFGGLRCPSVGNAVGDPSFEGGLAWSASPWLVSRPAILYSDKCRMKKRELNHAQASI